MALGLAELKGLGDSWAILLDQGEVLDPPVGSKVAMAAEPCRLHVASPLASWP